MEKLIGGCVVSTIRAVFAFLILPLLLTFDQMTFGTSSQFVFGIRDHEVASAFMTMFTLSPYFIHRYFEHRLLRCCRSLKTYRNDENSNNYKWKKPGQQHININQVEEAGVKKTFFTPSYIMKIPTASIVTSIMISNICLNPEPGNAPHTVFGLIRGNLS